MRLSDRAARAVVPRHILACECVSCGASGARYRRAVYLPWTAACLSFAGAGCSALGAWARLEHKRDAPTSCVGLLLSTNRTRRRAGVGHRCVPELREYGPCYARTHDARHSRNGRAAMADEGGWCSGSFPSARTCTCHTFGGAGGAALRAACAVHITAPQTHRRPPPSAPTVGHRRRPSPIRAEGAAV